MKKLLLVFSVCCTGYLCGCTSHREAVEALPPLQPVAFDSVPSVDGLLSVTRLFVTGDLLVAYEETRDTLFSFWQLPDCRYLFRAGIRGDGPDDLLTLDRTFRATEEGFTAFELETSRMKEVAVDKAGHSLRVISTKPFDGGAGFLNRFIFLKDGHYCCVSNDEKHEYLLLDNQGGVRPFGTYPEDLLPEKEGDLNRFVYNKLTVAAPSGEKFAAFYAYVKLCRMYDSEGRLLKETLLEQPRVADNGERQVYYVSYPCATDEAIYALTESDGEPVLEVWDWDGKLTARYSLPYAFTALAYAPHDGFLYAVRAGEEKDLLYKLLL